MCVVEAAEQMGMCCLVIHQTGELSDSVSSALSKELNPRPTAAIEWFVTLVTIHVNTTNSRNGGKYQVPDKCLCLFDTFL